MAKLDNKKDHKGLKLDATDRENIENAIKIYERMNPPGKVQTAEFTNPKTGQEEQWIEYCNLQDHINYMRSQVIDNRHAKKFKSGRGISDQAMLVRVSVPPSFEAWINKAYPMLLTDPVQTDQFLKWFPKFDLTRD